MATWHYIAVADLAPGERMWSIVFPDFPGITSAATEFADVPQQARDALATAVEDMISQDEDLPAPVEEGRLSEPERAEFHNPRYIVVPVDVPDNPRRINVSMDRGLLRRIDDAASRRGMTRWTFWPRAPESCCARFPINLGDIPTGSLGANASKGSRWTTGSS